VLHATCCRKEALAIVCHCSSLCYCCRFASLVSKLHTKLIEALLAEVAASGTSLRWPHWAAALGLDATLLVSGVAFATKCGGVPLWIATTVAEFLATCCKVRCMLSPAPHAGTLPDPG
jgi:hypothetical protein